MKKFSNQIFNLSILGLFLLVSGCSLGEGGTETSVRTPTSQNGSSTGSTAETGNGSTPSLGNDSGSSSSSSSAGNSNAALSAMETDAFNQVNEYRASKGLAALTWNSTIASVARGHSVDMAKISVLSHDGFDARGATLQASVGWSAIGENVALNGGFADPAATAVSGWIASPGHEENMVGNYTRTGMGVAISTDGSYYFTQIFLR